MGKKKSVKCVEGIMLELPKSALESRKIYPNHPWGEMGKSRFFVDRIYRIIRMFGGVCLSAKGRHHGNPRDPVNPV